MRRLISSTLMSLNGVVGNPHEWAKEFDATSAAAAQGQLERSHAMLMGRRTYEVFSKLWPATPGEYANAINNMRKYVFSSTLESADWTNATVVKDDVATTVAKLKAEGDDDLVIYGHGRLGRALLEHGLIDQFNVMVFPRFVPSGTLMFHEGEAASLEHVHTTTLPTGVVVLAYRPRGS
jgi:dihydrofolate reductase